MKKYKILFLIIIFLLCTFLIPLSYSKYSNTIRRTFNLNIYAPQKPYFMEFDGSNGELFGFTKSSIEHFSRNTTLSKSEVLAKSGVQLISSVSNDAYRSTDEIYGWVENNTFYWWSEAEIVYFHPHTLAPFKEMSNVLTIDLTGTDTSDVENFAHWFDTDRKLTTINGQINTSGLKLEYNNSYDYTSTENNDSSGKGLAYMFNDCNALLSIDLSLFDTSNASDMKRMFAGCTSIESLDVSNFDTSNVKSMYWMFRKMESLKKLDLDNFTSEKLVSIYGMFMSSSKLESVLFGDDFTIEHVVNTAHVFHSCGNIADINVYYFNTSNVTNMAEMFRTGGRVKSITLGPNFDTSNVTDFTRIFYDDQQLRVIYVQRDFDLTSAVNYGSPFQADANLIGGYGTSNKTTFKDRYNNITYARINTSEQIGLFTYYDNFSRYKIDYILNGGTPMHYNREYYGNPMINFNLFEPIKEGYIFTGWSSYSGESPVPVVTISNSMSGDKTYTANYVEADTVFYIPGTCNFNGSEANITGDDCINIADPTNPISYTNDKYIDTQINLYDSTNFNKNYEITFTVSNYSHNAQVDQATLMNAKMENSSLNYPGIAFRRGGDPGYIELTQTLNGKKARTSLYCGSSCKVTISRKNGYITYKLNDYELYLLQDMRTYTQQFVQSLWFGAAPDGSGGVQRHFVGTLSNIVVKLER